MMGQSLQDRFQCIHCGAVVSNLASVCPKCGFNPYPPDNSNEDALPGSDIDQEGANTQEKVMECIRCGKAMEKGYILDRDSTGRGMHLNGHYSERAIWVEARPQDISENGLDITDRWKYVVTTYRCVECGYLESYAKDGADW